MIGFRVAAPLLGALALSACGGAGGSVASPGTSPSGPPASAYGAPKGLLGADARRLQSMFGTPRLDILDKTVHKLQFANGRCVLDAYLYAPARGKEPVVTYVDARTPAGQDVDPTACANALQQK